MLLADGHGAIDWAVAATRPLADRFEAAGYSLYLVGGVVRDQFLDMAGTDRDLDCTTDARPDEILAVIEEIADATWRQGEQFGTIGCRVGDHLFEITTHRADAYEPDSRKPVVAFGDDIDDDLARRDFTVNAMAVDLSDGALRDPYGGRRDLEAGVLRTPLDPRVSFSEDPLRMIRAARFIAGYDLVPVPDLVAAVTTMADRVAIVSRERVRDELEKLLLVVDPTPGLEFLADAGLWVQLFAHLDPVTAAERGRRVASAARDIADRWAAFVSIGGVEDLAGLRLSNAVMSDVGWLLSVVTQVAESPPRDDRELRLLGQLVPEGQTLERALDLAEALAAADESGPSPSSLRAHVTDLRDREPDFDRPELPLDGAQVMAILGLDPGPAVGQAIERLRRHRVDHGPFDAEEATRILTEP